MESKLKTIGHYGVIFGESEYDIEQTNRQISGKPFYMGTLEDFPREKAHEIAELHPNCIKYNEAAMAVLYKGYDKNLRKGTEDPVWAIESLKTPKESEIDMPYIIIWNIFD